MAIYEHTLETDTYDLPELVLPNPGGQVLVHGVAVPEIVIPMIVTVQGVPKRTPKVNIVTGLSLRHLGTNLSYGGTTISEGNVELPKMQIEGTIDTPTEDAGKYRVSSVMLGGFRITYAEFILKCFEGTASTPTWRKIEPLRYRDPYGRIFENPRILDFSGNFVEAVPGRTAFSLQLQTINISQGGSIRTAPGALGWRH